MSHRNYYLNAPHIIPCIIIFNIIIVIISSLDVGNIIFITICTYHCIYPPICFDRVSLVRSQLTHIPFQSETNACATVYYILHTTYSRIIDDVYFTVNSSDCCYFTRFQLILFLLHIIYYYNTYVLCWCCWHPSRLLLQSYGYIYIVCLDHVFILCRSSEMMGV